VNGAASVGGDASVGGPAAPVGSSASVGGVSPVGRIERVALVTGAARGIGAAVVRRLAAAGWGLVAVDVCADDPAIGYSLATRAELDALAGCGAVIPVVADVRDGEALRAAVGVAVERFGGLDAAVAAAGVVAGGGPHWESAVASERAVLEVDLVGVLNLARAAVPALLQRPQPRQGRFVAVASAAASRGLTGLAAYSAAKAGVAGFVRALAADLAGSGITANAVSPGSTDTAMLAASAALYGLAGVEEFAGQQPVRRLLEPDEVAAAVAFLAGPDGAAITGAVLAVDGGLAL
jgi:SDR family mycofactocin-dependent oxidoreductase